jgi:hypothetical protein
MIKRHKDILRSIVGKLRETLVGTYRVEGVHLRGDLDRELERIGIGLDGSITPIDSLLTPSEQERRAHSVATAQLLSVPEKDRISTRAELVERAGYSWINRLLALRAMEARGLIDETLRANPDYDGIPEALFVLRQSEPGRVAQEDGGWWAVIEDACRSQTGALPGLFDLTDPTVALRPSTAALLTCVAVAGSAPSGYTIEEADVAFADPDAIGWAYQFYQEESKARTYAKLGSGGKVSTRSEIAAATQLFTEPYMVKWLLQNSLGRSYQELFPDTALPATWEYYIKPEKLEPPAYIGMASLTVMDPCCGSGHFLREAFDMLAAMYREQHPELTTSQVADTILQKHLHGVDIDPRAAQLTILTLYLRAWELVREEHRRERKPGRMAYKSPKVMNIASTPTGLDAGALERHLRRHPQDQVLKPLLEGIFSTLEQADILGSLLRPGEHLDMAIAELQRPHQGTMDFNSDDTALRRTMTELAKQDPTELKRMLLDRVADSFASEASRTNDVVSALFGHEAEQGVRLLQLLDQRYGVVVTNPPYVSIASMGSKLKSYVEHHYSAGKHDIYAALMIRGLELCSTHGRLAMITQQSWMFLRTFASMRAISRNSRENHGENHIFTGILQDSSIEAIAQLGTGAFDEIGGAVVQCAMFVLKSSIPGPDHTLLGIRLTEIGSATEKASALRTRVRSHNGLRRSQRTLLGIPEAQVLYWLDDNLLRLMTQSNNKLGALGFIGKGMSTSDNNRFVRFAWETPSQAEWIHYAKGGGYKRWGGLEQHRLDWRQNGSRLKLMPGFTLRNADLVRATGHPGITYSLVAGGNLGVRRITRGMFDMANVGVFLHDEKYQPPIQAILNGRLATIMMRNMTQSLNFSSGYMENFPLPCSVSELPSVLSELSHLCNVIDETLLATDAREDSFDVAIVGLDRTRLWALLHAAEGLVEEYTFNLYGYIPDTKHPILAEVGTPCGWFPLISGYDRLLDHTCTAALRDHITDHLVRHNHVTLLPGALAEIKGRLTKLYQDPSSGIALEETMDNQPDNVDESELASSASANAVPAQSFLEQLSQRLQIHPISVYWLLKELREEGLRCKPEEQRLLEDRLSVLVLRLLGHRWPRQIEAGESVPDWADRDGIIPLTNGLGVEEQTLADRLRGRLRAEDGEAGAQQAEALLLELTGMSLEEWLRKRLFTRHVRQLKYRPIAWHLASSPQSAVKRGGKRSPAFECMLYYHACKGDVLPRIRTRYVEPLLRAERRRVEDALQAKDETTAALATDRIRELEDFVSRLRQIEESGFACPELHKLLVDETLDRWTGDGYVKPSNHNVLAQNEQAWRVDINDGVRVNIAPLQLAGVLAGDVLKAADAKNAIGDRARWRSDERMWVREGKLPRCGWMGDDVQESTRWTQLAPKRAEEQAKREKKRKAALTGAADLPPLPLFDS